MLNAKENETVEIVEENEDIMEVENKGAISKFKTGLKKYGKPIAIGAMVVGATVIGYALGHKSENKTSDVYELESGDTEETEDYDNETED